MSQCGGPRPGAHLPGAGARGSAVSRVTCAFPAAPVGALELQEAWRLEHGPHRSQPLTGGSAVRGRCWVCPPSPPTAACPPRRPRLSCTRAALVSQESACYFYCVNKASWFSTQLLGAGFVLSVGGVVTSRRVAPLLWAGTGRAWGLSVPSEPPGQICKVGEN